MHLWGPVELSMGASLAGSRTDSVLGLSSKARMGLDPSSKAGPHAFNT